MAGEKSRLLGKFWSTRNLPHPGNIACYCDFYSTHLYLAPFCFTYLSTLSFSQRHNNMVRFADSQTMGSSLPGSYSSATHTAAINARIVMLHQYVFGIVMSQGRPCGVIGSWKNISLANLCFFSTKVCTRKSSFFDTFIDSPTLSVGELSVGKRSSKLTTIVLPIFQVFNQRCLWGFVLTWLELHFLEPGINPRHITGTCLFVITKRNFDCIGGIFSWFIEVRFRYRQCFI